MFAAYNQNLKQFRFSSPDKNLVQSEINRNFKNPNEWSFVETKEQIKSAPDGTQYLESLFSVEFLNAEKAEEIRQKRNKFLTDSDWTQGNDCPLSNEMKEKWAEYRQALRDITEQSEFPFEINWPEKP